ncbi:MAG: hypothetical protein ACKVQV_09800 [Bacteroidia bacterium]
MNESKKDPMDPELYWPEAEKLLEKHYTAKRRRRAIVLFGAVIIGLISVFLINSKKENYSEKIAPANIEKGEDVSAVNRNQSTSQAETNQPHKEENVNSNKKSSPSETNSTLLPIETVVAGTNKAAPVTSTKSKQNVTNSNDYLIDAEVKSTVQGIHPSKQEETKSNDLNTNVEEQGINVSSGNSQTIKSELNFSDVDFIASLPMLKWNGKNRDEVSILPDNRPPLVTKKKAKWDLLVYGGINSVQKELTGKSSSSYLLRREKEELPADLPFGGLQLSKSIRNWDFRGGLELSVIGEQVKYSPYANGEYYNQKEVWQSNNYIVTDTDSAYIWGMLFLNTTDYVVIDSVKVTVTDTLNGTHYNTNIRNANGINRWYVMELPLEVLYQVRLKRWGIGFAAGIAPGLVVQSSGYYLKEDESGYSSIKKYNKQQFTLNARAGIEISYLLNTRCRLLLRPSSQYSITKMEAGAKEKQRYQRNGLSVGLLYMIP